MKYLILISLVAMMAMGCTPDIIGSKGMNVVEITATGNKVCLYTLQNEHGWKIALYDTVGKFELYQTLYLTPNPH